MCKENAFAVYVPNLFQFCTYSASHSMPPPPSPSQRDATPRTNTAAGYITAGYITDPDTHREQRGPLSDFWVPGRLPGGSREAKEGAAPCAPCRTPCTSGRPPRAPTHGLMSGGVPGSHISLPEVEKRGPDLCTHYRSCFQCFQRDLTTLNILWYQKDE